jgi:hypothetical protein
MRGEILISPLILLKRLLQHLSLTLLKRFLKNLLLTPPLMPMPMPMPMVRKLLLSGDLNGSTLKNHDISALSGPSWPFFSSYCLLHYQVKVFFLPRDPVLIP